MNQKANIDAAFTRIATAGESWVKVGDRERVRCLVPNGVEAQAERRAGRIDEVISAQVTVSAKDFGARPIPGDAAQLEHGGNSYSCNVSKEDTTSITGSGSLYEFSIAND